MFAASELISLSFIGPHWTGFCMGGQSIASVARKTPAIRAMDFTTVVRCRQHYEKSTSYVFSDTHANC